jgi:hypothetical protein
MADKLFNRDSLPPFAPLFYDFGEGVYGIQAMQDEKVGEPGFMRSTHQWILACCLAIFIAKHADLKIVSSVYEDGVFILITEKR